MKKILLMITIFAFLFISLYLLRAQEVKIKIENGIQVVYNPKNPVPLTRVLTKNPQGFHIIPFRSAISYNILYYPVRFRPLLPPLLSHFL